MISYRSELVGIISLLRYIKEKGFSNTAIEMWSDNEAVVNILNDKKELNVIDLDMAESDLVRAGKELMKRLTKVTLQHVKGHQTNKMRYEDLTFEAQLNEDCDKEAKERMRNGTETKTRPKPTPGSKAMLYLKNNLVTTKMEEQIQRETHEGNLKEYIKDKY